MLLSIGDPNDLTAVYVGWLAERRGLPVLRLAEDRYGVDWWANLDERTGVAELVVGGAPVPVGRVRGAFVRFNPEPAAPAGWELGDPARELFIQERRAGISEVIEGLGVPVVNRPSAGRSNGAKPMHMARLRRHGFAVPEWVAANDLGAVTGALAGWPEGAVVKAASGLRSHVRRADDEYLARVAGGTTPSVVQRYVPGYEVRVHVVGERTFGARIVADAVDYRFDAPEVEYRQEEVPASVARRCVDAAARDGLVLAGLDFRVDGGGTWWCLEMNPVPTFLPYEASTGCAIGDAVLDWMLGVEAPTNGRSPLAEFMQAAGA